MSGTPRRVTAPFKVFAVERGGGIHGAWGWAAPCYWCQWWFPLEWLTQDHHPVRHAEGGTRQPDNVVLACAPCNNHRHPENARGYPHNSKGLVKIGEGLA